MAKLLLTGQNFDIYNGDNKDPFARTGATSIEMLDKAGAEGTILGHSEVGDPVEITTKKFQTLLEKRKENPELLSSSTILVGETWEEFTGHSKEEIAEIVSKHTTMILENIPEDFLKKLVIGYEPKWGSRGSGHDDQPPPSPELISACVKKIKEKLEQTFGETGKNVPIIYGGRSTPERTEQILADTNVEGLILGSACNTVQKTLDIAHAMEKVMGKRKKILHANFKAYNLPDSYEAYATELKRLDDTFIVYLSPCHTDIYAVEKVLK